jgi:transcription initiation factor TFIID TATA-box-binding protein
MLAALTIGLNKLKYQIRNVISTADLKQSVDAAQFVNYTWGTYDLQYHGGRCGYIKDEHMHGRVSVFLSGKMISTGAKTISESINQLQRAMAILVYNKYISPVKLVPKVQNIVATVNLGNGIDINKLAEELPRITFEPEQFPAIIFRTIQGPVCLIFSSGKLVIVGSKSEKQISICVKNLKSLIKNFFI